MYTVCSCDHVVCSAILVLVCGLLTSVPTPCVLQRYSDWVVKFGHRLGKRVVLLTGETSVDLRMLRDVSECGALCVCMYVRDPLVVSDLMVVHTILAAVYTCRLGWYSKYLVCHSMYLHAEYTDS